MSDEEELIREGRDEIAQETQEEAEAEKTEEAPQVSEIIIQFAAPGSSNAKMVVHGLVTPDQIGLAGMHLLNQAWNLWGSQLVENIVYQVVGEVFQQMERQAQEEQVRQMLRTGRPN